jgi:hypothetical protein
VLEDRSAGRIAERTESVRFVSDHER